MYKMTSIVELTKVGEKLGYKDEELRDFIKAEQARERDERHSRLEEEKERIKLERERAEEQAKRDQERLESLEQQAKERLEEQARIEKERLAEQARLDRDNMLQQARLEREKLEVARKLETEHKLKIDRDRIKDKGKVKVKMLAFDEKVDSLDAYLSVYESYAQAQEWEVDIWALNLPFLIKGTAREVYDRLPPDEHTNYEKLKDALLRQFELTEDGYKKRERFRFLLYTYTSTSIIKLKYEV